MTLGPVRVMGAGVVVMLCVEEVATYVVRIKNLRNCVCSLRLYTCICRHILSYSSSLFIHHYLTVELFNTYVAMYVATYLASFIVDTFIF